MHEQLHWAAGSRLPIVMCCVNRGVGAPWSIFNDQQDSISQRDTGWIQIYCRDNQEILDSVIQAYRIAEEVYVPVMVCYDGFVLSHTMMPVSIPEEKAVNSFLPLYKPHTVLSAENPYNINPVIFPWLRENSEGIICDGYMEMRYKLQEALDSAREVIVATGKKYAKLTGRNYEELLWRYKTDDAQIVLTGMGSIATEATVASDLLRQEGIKAGVIGIRVFRPFPVSDVQKAFSKAQTIIVLEKDISYGYEGALCSDIKAALYGTGINVPIHNFIAGLGGRDVKARGIFEAVQQSLAEIAANKENNKTIWLNCRK
jgi:pyruvate/2-oxoacid:ferredoxin oxidoreductase alpha subunit